jgi:hypothetical protein
LSCDSVKMEAFLRIATKSAPKQFASKYGKEADGGNAPVELEFCFTQWEQLSCWLARQSVQGYNFVTLKDLTPPYFLFPTAKTEWRSLLISRVTPSDLAGLLPVFAAPY